MEELQDAIEDAQYMNAMQDGLPKPTKEWERPSAEEIKAYFDDILRHKPHMINHDGIMSGCLGFYMFLKFVEDNDEKHCASFIFDVSAFRGKVSENIEEIGRSIISMYIVENSTGNPDSLAARRHDVTRTRGLSVCKLAQDDVLKPSSSHEEFESKDSTKYPSSELESTSLKQRHWSNFRVAEEFVPNSNAIRFQGNVIEKLIRRASAGDFNRNMFDEIESFVYSYVVDTYFELFKSSSSWMKYHDFMSLLRRDFVEDDFALFRVLGRGGFGLVSGCKQAYTGKLFAMKVMSKTRVKLKRAETLCMNERNILAMVNSPYVVCLKYAFVTQTDLHLILDLMIGGDLGFHLSRKGRFSIAEARYYSARIVVGIAALHDLSIVYRDLKPENILMDENGRTKISDLGLACRVGSSGVSGTCGTRGYWAPEMLRRDAKGKRERYSVSVDWFSLGCVIYEFIYGGSPFRTERAKRWGNFPKLEKADKGKAIDLAIQEMEPEFNDLFDSQSRDLISKLLIKDPKRRLGARGFKEIMRHPWFSSIDFDTLNIIPAPSQPSKDLNIATQSEIGAFEDNKSQKKSSLTEEDHRVYTKWPFVNEQAFQEEIVEFLCYEELNGPLKPLQFGQSTCCSIS